MADRLSDGPSKSLSTSDFELDLDQAPQPIYTPKEHGSAPTLLLMAGFAGAGKTTLAKWLNGHLKWKVLSKDDLKRARLAKGEEVGQAGWNAFEDLFHQLEYETIQHGESVIIDTSNEKPFIFDTIMEILGQMENNHIQLRLKVILCFANEEKRTQRLHARGSVFAPYLQELPIVLDDSQWTKHFKQLFFDDSELLEQFQCLLNDPAKLANFAPLVSKNALIVNTNPPLETYSQSVLIHLTLP